MTDVECQYCGETFDERGIAVHEQHCDEAETAETTPSADDFDGLEAQALRRDDRQCRRCGATEALTVHAIRPDEADELRHLATVCADCEAELEGHHPRTKRTLIHNP